MSDREARLAEKLRRVDAKWIARLERTFPPDALEDYYSTHGDYLPGLAKLALHYRAERDALAARVTELETAILACIGDADGQEAVRDRNMLLLTKGQVQWLAAALAGSSPNSTEGAA